MKKMEEKLWEPGEYQYAGAYGFEPEMHGYLHADSEIRPCVIIAPGGGYQALSPSEGEIVAEAFFEKGYQTFVCAYTTNPLGREPLKLQPLQDLSRAVRWVRSRAEEFHVAADKVVICGFSAGGHLCGSLCVHFEDIPEENPKYGAYSNRPDAAVLSYPVITAGEKAHQGSMDGLLGKNATEEELRYMSLEFQVTKETTPCFLWQTETDEIVPVENSYLMAAACREKGIRYALHIFSEGVHGLSLSNAVWATNMYGGKYVLKQTEMLLDKIHKGELEVTKEELAQVEELAMIGNYPKEDLVSAEVEGWFDMALAWLEKVM